MAAAEDEVIVRFRADGADQVARAFDGVAGSSQRLDRNLAGLALTSERRVRRQLGGIAQDLLYIQDPAQLAANSILRLSETFRVGLGAGVAATVGVVLVDSIIKAHDAAEALHESLDKITQYKGSGLFRAGGDLDKELDEKLKKLKELQDDRYPASASGVAKRYAASGSLPGGINALNAREDQDIARAKGSINETLDAQIEKQNLLSKISHETVSGSQKEADLMKAKADFQEKLGTLQERYSGVADVQRMEQLENNLRSQYQDEVSSVQKKYELKKLEEESENRILNLKFQGSTTEQESLETAKEKFELLKKQKDAVGSVEEKSALGTKIHAAANELITSQIAAGDQSPEAVRARNAAKLKALHDQAFASNLEPPPGDAYGRIISGVGAVGPQSAPRHFTASVFQSAFEGAKAEATVGTNPINAVAANTKIIADWTKTVTAA